MTKDVLIKYLSPASSLSMFGVAIVLFGFFLLFSLGLPAIIVILGGFLFTSNDSTTKKGLDQQITRLQASGELSAVLEDFSASKQMVQDKIRIGNKYLFGKGQGQVVRYRDIQQLYQYVFKQNGAEGSRQLRYIGTDGKMHTLCELLPGDKSKDDVVQIMTIVKSKNPAVQLGYK